MSMDTGRRSVVQAGAAAAVAAPLLRPTDADAATDAGFKMSNTFVRPANHGMAPMITVMDHRGCNRGGPNKEYFGIKANGPEDEMCVKVQSKKIDMNEAFAARFLSEAISLKEKGIDGTYSSNA